MSSQLLQQIEAIVGTQGLLVGDAVRSRSAGIWSDSPLQALALVRPKSVDEVSQVLACCHRAKQPVVPAGGLTGLAGGHWSTNDDILLSTERLNRIEPVDTRSRTVVVESGAILEQVQQAADQAGLMFALDLGARGSCTIGGNIATNAGGIRVLRYGMMREQVLGLEAVLADGTIVSSMSSLLKNNTGYDLRQLFIGSEGTLGMVTRAVLRLHEIPKRIDTLLLAVPDWQRVMSLLRFFEAEIPGGLGAYEVLWRSFYELQTGDHSKFAAPLAHGAPYYVLIDVFTTGDNSERLEFLLNDRMEAGDIMDGTMAFSEADRQKIWQIREDFEPEQERYDYIIGHDVSLPIDAMEDYVDDISAAIVARFPDAAVYTYGHIGDGNIHTSIYPGAARDKQAIDELVYQRLEALNGSISAEHGIGLEKKAYLPYSRNPAEIELMRRTKRMMDPENILNPGKLFDL